MRYPLLSALLSELLSAYRNPLILLDIKNVQVLLPAPYPQLSVGGLFLLNSLIFKAFSSYFVPSAHSAKVQK